MVFIVISFPVSDVKFCAISTLSERTDRAIYRSKNDVLLQ